MDANAGSSPATIFGKQMRRKREAMGLTLREFCLRAKINYTTGSAVENGHRPPNERIAAGCDSVVGGNDFAELYREMKTWAPPGFRDWSEYENRALELTIWVPNVFDGSVQIEPYARALLSLHPGVTDEVIQGRLKTRMQRQQRLIRPDGPTVLLLVDQVALYRATGSAEIMAAQCQRLTEVAAMETVTVQVVPPIAHPLTTASAIVTEEAAYTENGLGGSVFTSGESVARLRRLVGSVRSEARPASESLAMIQEADRQWTGVKVRTARTADKRASKPRRQQAT
jgi:Domain of unknown function (DUF5753)